MNVFIARLFTGARQRMVTTIPWLASVEVYPLVVLATEHREIVGVGALVADVPDRLAAG